MKVSRMSITMKMMKAPSDTLPELLPGRSEDSKQPIMKHHWITMLNTVNDIPTTNKKIKPITIMYKSCPIKCKDS